MSTVGVSREEALRVLRRMRAGQPIAEALNASHRQRPLDPKDRALLTQLVYGVTRHRRFLDAIIGNFSKSPLEPDVRDILRLGFFQLRFLDKIPAYAVVNAAVEETKLVQPKATRLVNAVLRRGQSYEPQNLSLGDRYSHPDWLVERWGRRFGKKLPDILAANNQIPPLTLRINLDRVTRTEVIEELTAAGVTAEPSPYLEAAVRVTGSVWLEDLPVFQSGRVTVQDESGMLVTLVMDPKPSERILDLAAGVGGKTGHILEYTQGESHVVAMDVSAERLDVLRRNVTRLGFAEQVETIRGDATKAPEALGLGGFDRVLVDAPCSNLGVLRRRVDARWNKSLEDLKSHQTRQVQLLKAAILAAKPSGVIVYSTCSVEPEETLQVIGLIETEMPGVRRESVAEWLPHPALRNQVEDGTLTLLPGDFGMDGFFIARLRTEPGGGS